MVQDNLIRIYNTPKGPHVYLGDFRVHHWMGGLVAGGIGVWGLISDKNKNRRDLYLFLCLAGSLAFLDDLADFISFIQGNSEYD
jgi:hypothetical protein